MQRAHSFALHDFETQMLERVLVELQEQTLESNQEHRQIYWVLTYIPFIVRDLFIMISSGSRDVLTDIGNIMQGEQLDLSSKQFYLELM